MRNLSIAVMCLALMTGCASHTGSAVLGGAVGAGAGVGAYEIHMKNQKNRVEEDFKAGKIDKREYDIRKDQIARDSFFQ